MPWENPWAYHESRNRIREKQEEEKGVVEKKKEEFEVGKEKIYRKKKLDVFDLKRKIETGQSLSLLKDDIKEALDEGSISIDTYNDAISALRKGKDFDTIDPKDFLIDPNAFPLSQNALAKYFEQQKLWENLMVDLGGMVYGFVQGSTFLLFLVGRILLDSLLLPRDIYQLIRE